MAIIKYALSILAYITCIITLSATLVSCARTNDHKHYVALDKSTIQRAKARTKQYSKIDYSVFTQYYATSNIETTKKQTDNIPKASKVAAMRLEQMRSEASREQPRNLKDNEYSSEKWSKTANSTLIGAAADDKTETNSYKPSFNTDKSPALPKRDSDVNVGIDNSSYINNNHNVALETSSVAATENDDVNDPANATPEQQHVKAKHTAISNATANNINNDNSDETRSETENNNSVNSSTTIKYKSKKSISRAPITDVEEYVSRVGKRLLIVIDGHNRNFEFAVTKSATPLIQVNSTGKISLSMGLLQKLSDEAELAAVLSQKIVSAASSNFSASLRSSAAQSIEVDKYAMVYMSRAGYDPKAAFELKKLALDSSNSRSGKWLDAIYGEAQVTKERIDANKSALDKLPAGLQRGKERYTKNINDSN